MVVNTAIVTDGQGSGINNADAATASIALLEINAQREERISLQLDKTIVADQVWKLCPQLLSHLMPIELFEIALANPMKPHQDCHHFTQVQPACSLALSTWQQLRVQPRRHTLTEVVNLTKQRYNVHQRILWVA